MKYRSTAEIPATTRCRMCGQEKPTLTEMVVFRSRRDGSINVRVRCKQCNNERERGHRREWKREYLRRWRAKHPDLEDAYNQKYRAVHAEECRQRSSADAQRDHEAILIQKRMAVRGMPVTRAEARELLRKFGPAYPTRHGLTPAGQREVERIRSATRRAGKPMSRAEIYLMLYEDGDFVKKPSSQPTVTCPGRARAMKRQWATGAMRRKEGTNDRRLASLHCDR